MKRFICEHKQEILPSHNICNFSWAIFYYFLPVATLFQTVVTLPKLEDLLLSPSSFLTGILLFFPSPYERKTVINNQSIKCHSTIIDTTTI